MEMKVKEEHFDLLDRRWILIVKFLWYAVRFQQPLESLPGILLPTCRSHRHCVLLLTAGRGEPPAQLPACLRMAFSSYGRQQLGLFVLCAKFPHRRHGGAKSSHCRRCRPPPKTSRVTPCTSTGQAAGDSHNFPSTLKNLPTTSRTTCFYFFLKAFPN